MGVRKVEDAAGLLGEHFVSEAAALARCQIGEAIRKLTPEARERLLETIARVMAHLRSGRARKEGDAGALSRIAEVASAVKARAGDVQNLLAQVQALRDVLNPEAILGDLTQQAETAATAVISERVRSLGSGDCGPVKGAITTTISLSSAVAVMDTARSAQELLRQVQVAWNSNIDFISELNFEAVADEVLGKLEDQLVALVTAATDEGERYALEFINQKLTPEQWVKAVRPT